MLKRKTVFVLGAGASEEFGFPLGGQLVPAIEQAVDIRYEMGSQLVSGDPKIAYALKKKFIGPDGDAKPYNDVLHICKRLKQGLAQGPTSIDTYLDAHSQDTNMIYVGKLAIARLILAAEAHSLLREADGTDINIQSVKDTWLPKLRELLFAGTKKERASECLRNAVFISFNYDRCLEHFLYYSFRKYMHLDDAQAADCMRELKLFFPYGSVASLPWQSWKKSDDLKLGFGADPVDSLLHSSSNRIRLFTERVNDTAQMTEIHRALSEAEQVVFLGFGFHQQNMELLTIKQRAMTAHVFGTAYRQSSQNMAAIKNSIEQALALGPAPKAQLLPDAKCAQLFDDLSHVLRSG